MANNTGRNIGIAVLVIVFLGVLFLAFGTQQTQLAGDRVVEIPVFASVECQQLGTSKTLTEEVALDGEWISDSLPSNTNEWNVIINTPQSSTLTSRFVEFFICPSRTFDGCLSQGRTQVARAGDSLSLGVVSSDNHVWVQFQSGRSFAKRAIDGAIAVVTYKPFILIRDDPFRGGRQELSDSIGCTVQTLSTLWLKRITSFSGSSDVDTWTGNNQLRPGDFYNYITTNVLAVTEGNTQSGGWCLFENSQANIYEIENIATGDGTQYNRVNLDNRIATAECCENEVTPSGQICENGNLINILDVQCNSRADCGNIEFFETSDSEKGRFGCVNNQCEIVDRQEVDCTVDTQCSTNERCSRNTFTCVQASVEGDAGLERLEVTTRDQCLAKAEDQPALGWTWIEATREVGTGPLGIGRIIGSTEQLTEGECKASFVPWYIFGGVIILILIVLAIFFTVKKK